MTDPAPPSPPPRVRELVVAAAVLLVWRIAACPWTSLWRDWLTVIGVYGVYTAFRGRSRDWPIVTVATMALLLVLYASVQAPLAWSVWESRP